MNGTDVEKILWKYLRARHLGEKFRRQVGVGGFIVDFCCFSKKLVVELDGGVHKVPKRKTLDEQRTRRLEELGYKVIRFWNGDVINNLDEILEKIKGNLTLPL